MKRIHLSPRMSAMLLLPASAALVLSLAASESLAQTTLNSVSSTSASGSTTTGPDDTTGGMDTDSATVGSDTTGTEWPDDDDDWTDEDDDDGTRYVECGNFEWPVDNGACWLVSAPDYAYVQCYCGDENFETKLDAKELFELSYDELYKRCEVELENSCGDVKDTQRVECHSDYGHCQLGAGGKVDESTTIAVDCNCIDDSGWNYRQRIGDDIAVSHATLKTACREELSLCRSPLAGGQGEALTLPTENNLSVEANCRSDYGNCYMASNEYADYYYCGCFNGAGESAEGDFDWGSAEGSDLLEICFDWVTMCGDHADPDDDDDESDDDIPDSDDDGDDDGDPSDPDIEDIEDIFDIFGCSATAQNNSAPLSLLALLGLGGLLRRRRR